MFFPSTDIPVIAAYSDPSSLLAMRYDQESGDFTLKGTVALRGGEVFYIQRNFFLRSGKIVFNEGSDRFEPQSHPPRRAAGPERAGRPGHHHAEGGQRAPLEFPAAAQLRSAHDRGADRRAHGAEPHSAPSTDNSVDIRKTVISGTQFIPQLDVTRRFDGPGPRQPSGSTIIYVRTQVLQNWLIDYRHARERNREMSLGATSTRPSSTPAST